jgi:hypothetical protein
MKIRPVLTFGSLLKFRKLATKFIGRLAGSNIEKLKIVSSATKSKKCQGLADSDGQHFN